MSTLKIWAQLQAIDALVEIALFVAVVVAYFAWEYVLSKRPGLPKRSNRWLR